MPPKNSKPSRSAKSSYAKPGGSKSGSPRTGPAKSGGPKASTSRSSVSKPTASKPAGSKAYTSRTRDGGPAPAKPYAARSGEGKPARSSETAGTGRGTPRTRTSAADRPYSARASEGPAKPYAARSGEGKPARSSETAGTGRGTPRTRTSAADRPYSARASEGPAKPYAARSGEGKPARSSETAGTGRGTPRTRASAADRPYSARASEGSAKPYAARSGEEKPAKGFPQRPPRLSEKPSSTRPERRTPTSSETSWDVSSGASQYIIGKHAIHTLLQTSPRRIFKIFVVENSGPDRKLQTILDLAKAEKIPFQFVPKEKLDRLVVSSSRLEEEDSEARALPYHQGIVASASPKEFLTVEQLLQKSPVASNPLFVVLDEIQDPHNLGAILRIADGAGVSGVILPKHRGSVFGPGVSKSAAGADHTVDIAVATNLSQAIEHFKKAGFWVIGTSNTAEAKLYHEQDFKMPTILLMGNEEKGIGPALASHCDFWVKIPMVGQISSLNVSVASGILIYEWARQNRRESQLTV